MSATIVQIPPVVTGKDAPVPPAPDKKVETPAAPAGDKPQKPEWVPDKFWDAEKGAVRQEDLAKSYVELEKARNKPADKPEDKKPEDKPADKPEDKPKDDANKAPTPELQPFFDEFAKDGKLSDDSYKALEAKGISREMVDQFAAGAQAKVAAEEAEILEPVGGKEGYAKVVEWAGKNLKPAEIDAFNKVINGGDVEAMKLAVTGLNAKFTAAEGQAPNLIRGNVTNGSVEPFTSMAQVTEAMRNPKYATDPAYRDEVVARMKVSTVI